MANRKVPETAGSISSDEAYTLDELDRRLGIGRAALRTARRNGLQVRKIGRKAFVLGADVIKYLNQNDNGQVPQKTGH